MNTIAGICIGFACGVVFTLAAVLWLDEWHMSEGREA